MDVSRRNRTLIGDMDRHTLEVRAGLKPPRWNSPRPLKRPELALPIRSKVDPTTEVVLHFLSMSSITING